MREAALSGVILFCLPPNITHIAQPLDVTTFHSLKSHWYNVCDQYMSSHPGRKVTIQCFSKLFSQAWYEAMVTRTIMSGFRATGIYPFNRQSIAVPGGEKSTGTPTARLAYQQGIKYLPFHSPLRQQCLDSEQPAQLDEPTEQVCEQVSFSEEENRLFERRYEEGYDLSDSQYYTWLKAKKTALLTPPCLDPATSPEKYQRNALALSQEQLKEPLWH